MILSLLFCLSSQLVSVSSSSLPLFDWSYFTKGSVLTTTPDGNYLLTASDSKIQVFSRDQRGELSLTDSVLLPEAATSLHISPDAKEVLVAYQNAIGVFSWRFPGVLSHLNQSTRLIPCWTNFVLPFYSGNNSLEILVGVNGYGRVASFRRHPVSHELIDLGLFVIENATTDISQMIINSNRTQVFAAMNGLLYSLHRNSTSGQLELEKSYEICQFSNALGLSPEENQLFIACQGYFLVYERNRHTGVLTSPPSSYLVCPVGWPWSFGFNQEGTQLIVGCSVNTMYVFPRISLSGEIDATSTQIIELPLPQNSNGDNNVKTILFTDSSDGRAQAFVGLESGYIWKAKRVLSFDPDDKQPLEFVHANNNSITVSWKPFVYIASENREYKRKQNEGNEGDNSTNNALTFYEVVSESDLYGTQTCKVAPTVLFCTFKQPPLAYSNFSISIGNEVGLGLSSSSIKLGCPSSPRRPSVVLLPQRDGVSVIWNASVVHNPPVLRYVVIMTTRDGKERNFSDIDFSTASPTTFAPTTSSPTPFPTIGPNDPIPPTPSYFISDSPTPVSVPFPFTFNITNLADGVPVRFRIVAVNMVGESFRSLPTDEVVPSLCYENCGSNGLCDRASRKCICDNGWAGENCEAWSATRYFTHIFLPLIILLSLAVCGWRFHVWYQKRNSQTRMLAQIDIDD